MFWLFFFHAYSCLFPENEKMCYLYLDFYFMLLFRMDCCFSENEKSEKKVSSGGGDAEESNTEPVLQVNAELGKGQLLTKNTGT